MKTPKRQKKQDEVFLKLINGAANSGVFNRGELKSREETIAIARHLKGVSDIIAAVYTEEVEGSVK
jgi:hypothetical protein